MKIALGIEYNGRDFCGWQSQTGQRSVQQTLEQAVGFVANHAVTLVCAGRTDTGVHAVEQVAHFTTHVQRNPRQWVFGSNTRLSRDVAVLWAKPVDADFHARFSALQRHYRYLIFNRPVRSALWDAQVSWFCRPLDVAKMQEAAVYLHGEHDFSAFRASSCQAKNPVRTVSQLTLRAQGDWLALDIVANGFLHHMVRNIAGSLLAVGQGQYPPDWIKAVLASRSRSLAGVTALPNGLYFCQVIYPAHYALPQIAPAWPLSH